MRLDDEWNDSSSERFKSLSNEEKFEIVCRVLQAGHQMDPKHDPEDTLNRLFVKHLDGLQKDISDNPPRLISSILAVSLEECDKPKLRKLAVREQSRKPKREDLPVVIVRYRDRDCLIDGGSRLHKWHEEGDVGRHLAFVLTVNN